MSSPKYLLLDSNICCSKNNHCFNFTMCEPFNNSNPPKNIILRNISFTNNYPGFHPYFYVDINTLEPSVKTADNIYHTFIVYPDSDFGLTKYTCKSNISISTNKFNSQNFEITFLDSNHKIISYNHKYHFSILFELEY